MDESIIGASVTGLSTTNLKHLNYLLDLAVQPADEWRGFYRTSVDGMNFGLRFQLAFSFYALYGLARLTPAYRLPYQMALRALIEKMLRPEVWSYWFRSAVRNPPQPDLAATNRNLFQNAIEVTHTKLGINGSISPDPCHDGNVQYSGHLASMLGFYQLLSGDDYYDHTGFTLKAEAHETAFAFDYTYSSLATRIQQQMQENYFHGLCCEPGRAYAACNNHACISNLLYDQLYPTNFAAANARWAEWVKTRLLRGETFLPLPAPNGLLSVAYMPGLHLSIPLSFNLTDAWGLAFMAAWEPELARREYRQFRKKLRQVKSAERANSMALKLGSLGPNENLEISNAGLNTGFAYILAKEMGDQETARRLRLFADENLGLLDQANRLYYSKGRPASYVTALFALGDTLPVSGGGLYALVHWQPNLADPYLAGVEPFTPSETTQTVAVTRAEYRPDFGLYIELKSTETTTVEVRLGNCQPTAILKFRGVVVDKQTVPLSKVYNELDEVNVNQAYYEVESGQLRLRLQVGPPQNILTVQH